MCKKLVCLASIVLVFSLSADVSLGQDIFDFDGGGDGTSWSDPNNWEHVSDPNGVPVGGNPTAPPDALTDANIPIAGAVATAGSTGLNVRVGTAAGAGSLSLGAGGSLTSTSSIRIGADPNASANGGTLDITGGTLVSGNDIFAGNGSVGVITMSGGSATTDDDFFVNAGSSFTMTGGTLEVGDNFQTSGDASITIDGGTYKGFDDLRLSGVPLWTVDSGFVEVRDKIRFEADPNVPDGQMTINGGLVRAEEYGQDTSVDSALGTVEINGDGKFQVTRDTYNLPRVLGWISNGDITTTDAGPLGIQLVTVPDFFGFIDREFYQISIGPTTIPEPASLLLLSFGSLGLLVRRGKRSRSIET